MGEMSEYWKEEKEKFKERCRKRNDHYEPILITCGAIKKSDGVYEIKDYFLYPTKGFAMNKKTYKKQNLTKLLNKLGVE